VITTGKSKHRREAIIPLYDDLRAILAAIPKRSTTIISTAMADANQHFHDLRGTSPG